MECVGRENYYGGEKMEEREGNWGGWVGQAKG